MIRWTPAASSAASALALPLVLLSLATGARADPIRAFPDAALRGSLQASAPPAVELDGRPDQLAVGARIRDSRNLLVTSATLADGHVHVVNYTRGPGGQIGEVWLLTPAEAALRRPSGDPGWLERWFGS